MTDEQHALTLRISVKMYEPLRAEAFDRRIPISDVIREAVDAHLARRPATPPAADVEAVSRAEWVALAGRSYDMTDLREAVNAHVTALLTDVRRDAWDEGAEAGFDAHAPDDLTDVQARNPYRGSV